MSCVPDRKEFVRHVDVIPVQQCGITGRKDRCGGNPPLVQHLKMREVVRTGTNLNERWARHRGFLLLGGRLVGTNTYLEVTELDLCAPIVYIILRHWLYIITYKGYKKPINMVINTTYLVVTRI